MTSKGGVVSAIVLVALTTADPSSAFPSSRFTYARGRGAEGCPDETAIRKAVATRLGYDPFFPTADKTIVAVITRVRDELHASVQLVDNGGMLRGQREFKTVADKCEELVATMSLAISIAIDPTHISPVATPVAKAIEPASDATPKPERPVERPVDRVEPKEFIAPPAPKAPSFELRPGLGVTGSTGTAPAFALGLALWLELRRGWVSLTVQGRHDFPASIPAEGGARLSTSLWVGGLSACAHPSAFFVCALGSLGTLRGESFDVAKPSSDSGFYAAAGGRIGLDLTMSGPWYVRPHFDLLATLARAELQIDGTTRWTAPGFSALAGAGVGMRFP